MYQFITYVGLFYWLGANLITPGATPTTSSFVNADFTISSSTICLNETATLTYTGTSNNNASFAWSLDGGQISSGTGIGPLEVQWTTAGQKMITLTVDDGNQTFTNSQSIQIDTAYQVQIDTAICQGDLLMFNGNKLTESDTYTETFTAQNGCDSAVTLVLTIKDTFFVQTRDTICMGDEYQFGSQSITTAGTYSETFQSSFNCDSVVNLTIVVFEPKDTTIKETICDGDGVTIGNQTFVTPGIHTVMLTAQNECDSTVTLELDVLPSSSTSIAASICAGESYNTAGQTFDTTGLYAINFIAANGCDSTVLINLFVNPSYEDTMAVKICSGESFVVGDSTYTTTGTYRDTLQTGAGCDSIIHLNLLVEQILRDTFEVMLCQGEVFMVGDSAYQQSGIYLDTLTAGAGCDSIVRLSLTVLPTYNDTFDMAICANEFYIFGGDTLSLTGTYRDTFPATNGCDSLVQINLTHLPIYRDTTEATICIGDNYTFRGNNYNQSGFYPDTLISSIGCDSIGVLNLFVQEPISEIIDEEICAGDTVVVGGKFFSEPGFYLDTLRSILGCDSQIIQLTLGIIDTFYVAIDSTICGAGSVTVGMTSYSETGNYLDTLISNGGCDSIVALNLRVLPNHFTSIDTILCPGDEIFIGPNRFDTVGIFSVPLTSSEGCDSTVNLTLQYHTPISTVIDTTLCSGQFITIGDQVFRTAGTFEDTLTANNGCDSIIALVLDFHPPSLTNISATICQREFFELGDQVYSIGGVYRDTLVNTVGCDSIVELNLTVLSSPMTDMDTTICASDSIFFGDSFRNTSGRYRNTLTASTGCDSIVNLDLTVLPAYADTLRVEVCPGATYTFADTTFSADGEAFFAYETMEGCDSTVFVEVVFTNEKRTFLNQTICSGETYNFNGRILSNSGTFLDQQTSVAGCDSVVELTLTILPPLSTTIDTSFCQGDFPIVNGDTIRESRSFEVSLTSEFGCDSTLIVNLEMLPSYSIPVFESICEEDTLFMAMDTFTVPGIYTIPMMTEAGCDSTIVLNLNRAPEFNRVITQNLCQGDTLSFGDTLITQAGFYQQLFQTTAGCDSTVTLEVNLLSRSFNILDTMVCLGDTLAFGDTLILDSGQFRQIFAGPNGCDSTVILNVAFEPSDRELVMATICEGNHYTFGTDSLTVAGTYEQTFNNQAGCDSTVVLVLNIDTAFDTTIVQNLCLGSTYQFGDLTLSESGNYQRVFETINGCDSIVRLQLSIEDQIRVSIDQTICEGESYVWVMDTLTESGFYQNTFTSIVGGCDSIVNLNLSVVAAINTTLRDTICTGSFAIFGNQILRESGTYERTLISSEGCDSIITMDLTVLEPIVRNRTESLCFGDTLSFNGQNITEEGLYRFSLTSTNGCDSIITIKVNELPTATNHLDIDLCSGQSYVFGSETLTQSGLYERRITLDNEVCDSIIFLDLTIADTILTVIDTTICAVKTFSFNNRTLIAGGTYFSYDQSVGGCDSVTQLNLNIVDQFETILDVTLCPNESYPFGDQLLIESGIYEETYTAVDGCDSIVRLNLTIKESTNYSVEDHFCAGSVYGFGDRTLTEPGTYTSVFEDQAGCDSIVSLTLSMLDPIVDTVQQFVCEGETFEFNGQMLQTSGEYNAVFTSIAGCDSIVLLNLEVLPSIPSSIENVLLCSGDNYVFGEDTLSTSNVYTRTFMSSAGCDSTVTLILEIKEFGPAIINMDSLACDEDIDLVAVPQSGTTGRWSTTGSSVILAPEEALSNAFELEQGPNTFIWTLSGPECPSYDADTITVSLNSVAVQANADGILIGLGQQEVTGNVVANDSLGEITAWRTTLIEGPAIGQVTLTEDGDFTFQTESEQFFSTGFTYLLNNEVCPMFSDTARVEIRIDPELLTGADAFGMTLNGDGVNERFIIPELQVGPQDFPDNELLIFNRWGDLVYQAKPYNNDWEGTNEKGEQLSSGTYYFFLRLDTVMGLHKKGIIVILR